jgi:hypothetical protein
MQPTFEADVHLHAELVAHKVLAEELEDEQASQYITAVEFTLQNTSRTFYTFAPSQAALVGPRHQLVLAVDPAELGRFAHGGARWSSLSTAPYTTSKRPSSNPIARNASQKAPHSQVLAPGDASQGWLYFPFAVERASEEIPSQWLLAVALQDEKHQWREFRVRVEPPATALR